MTTPFTKRQIATAAYEQKVGCSNPLAASACNPNDKMQGWPCASVQPDWIKRYQEAQHVERADVLVGSKFGLATGCVPGREYYSAFHRRCIDQKTPSPVWSPIYQGLDPNEAFYVDSAYPDIQDPRYYVPQIPDYRVMSVEDAL